MRVVTSSLVPILALPWRVVAILGMGIVRSWQTTTYILAVIGAVLLLAMRPFTSWQRTVRDVFARQLLFTGVDAMFFAVRIAAAVGVLIIVQAELWLGTLGERELIGPILMRVIVRELAPLLANFVVIVRSGSAIATELAHMRLEGEVDVLDAQGIDPMTYLVMPRVLATSVAVFCLAIVFIAASFASGYIVGALLGTIRGGPFLFIDNVFSSVSSEDVYFFLPKTILTGLFIGAICSVEGLSVRGASTEIPQVAGRSAVRSLTVVFMVSALVSLVIYGSVLFIEVI